MKTLKHLSLAMILALFAMGMLATPGCEEKGPFERTGERIDRTNDDLEDAVEDAGDEIEDAVDDIDD